MMGQASVSSTLLVSFFILSFTCELSSTYETGDANQSGVETHAKTMCLCSLSLPACMPVVGHQLSETLHGITYTIIIIYEVLHICIHNLCGTCILTVTYCTLMGRKGGRVGQVQGKFVD